MLNRARRGGRDDAGSTLLIALMVMMILSTLSLGVLARSLSVMSFVRNGQDFDAALAEADAGLAHALRTLDGGATSTTFTATKPTGDAGNGTWTYRATRVSDAEYEVRVLGEVGESRHGVQAKVTRGARYPFTLFADDSLDLGAGGLNLGLSSWLTLGAPDTGEVHVGTNGEMIVRPGGDAGDVQHIYPPDGRCTGCDPDTLVVHDEDEDAYELPDVVKPPATTPTQACPLLGTFTGLVDGRNGRPFVCERDVALAGTVNVINPPFVLYVLPSSTGQHSSLDLRTAVVNAGLRADNVEIKKAGAAPLLLDLASTPAQLTFSGILYAPDSTLHLQGSKWWSGSVTVDRVSVSNGALGAPVLTLGYDLNLGRSSYVAWQVSRYSQIAASETGLMA